MSLQQPIQLSVLLRNPIVWIGIVAALFAIFYVITVHTAHTLAVLPYLVFLLCPLMHLFMMRGGHDYHGKE